MGPNYCVLFECVAHSSVRSDFVLILLAVRSAFIFVCVFFFCYHSFDVLLLYSFDGVFIACATARVGYFFLFVCSFVSILHNSSCFYDTEGMMLIFFVVIFCLITLNSCYSPFLPLFSGPLFFSLTSTIVSFSNAFHFALWFVRLILKKCPLFHAYCCECVCVY